MLRIVGYCSEGNFVTQQSSSCTTCNVITSDCISYKELLLMLLTVDVDGPLMELLLSVAKSWELYQARRRRRRILQASAAAVVLRDHTCC